MVTPMKSRGEQPQRSRRVPHARTPGQRAGLTREEVLSSARTIAEQHGLEQLSMRRVAASLGVAPNALYTYFADKTALLDALFDAILGEVELPGPGAEPWQDGLAELMRASRRLVLKHPHLTTLFLTRPGGRNAMRLGEAALRLLADGGIRGPEAVTVLRALLTYTLGFAAMEVPRQAEPGRTVRTQGAGSLIESLDPESFRATREHARELASHPGDDDFETGLRWLIRGIRAESIVGEEDEP
jgi:TetR/AcrR family transcriptional regulator, tetracycline repressor protein